METSVSAGPVDAGRYPSLTEAVRAMGATPATLLVSAPARLTADTVAPATLAIRVERTGLLAHGDYALTLLGPFEAGRHPVFAGDGPVTLGPASAVAVYAEWFGAQGDGCADDTRACRQALAATSGGLLLHLLNRRYAVSSLAVGPGMGGIRGPGTLAQNGEPAEAVVRLQGDGTGPVARAVIDGVTIETGEAKAAIVLTDAVEVRIENCRVTALRNGHQGIRLQHGCVNVQVRNNRIEADEATGSLVGLVIESAVAEGIAGFFVGDGGRITYLPETTYGNVVEGNCITGGTHGIAISGSSRNRIVNNTLSGNTHRNINICPAGRHNIVAHNHLLNAGSSAVAMAYGSSWNLVVHNVIQSHTTSPGVDRDAIHAYVSSCGNTIAGNQITGDYRYGVYLAVNARHNVVQQNVIHLTAKPGLVGDFTVGVALENDWPERPLPDGAFYSRRNFGSAPAPYTWGCESATGNVIRDNAISGCTCGVYLAQIGDTLPVTGNRVLHNTFFDIRAHEVFVHGGANRDQILP